MMMRKSFLLALFSIAVANCATAPKQTPAIAAAHADAAALWTRSASPGLAVAVVKNGRIVWAEGFGVTDVAAGTPVDPARSDFRIGSVTKLLTAVAFARLAEQGAVALDDPVHRYIPQFHDERVTLRQLAQHLGGIRHYGRSDYINTEDYPSATAALEKFINDPLVAEPGQKYFYSSYGYNLLGAAMERATGKRFEELIAELVLRPFEMRSTFDLPPDRMLGRIVTFYDRNDDGTIVRSREVDLTDRRPSGAYLSTAADLAHFMAGVFSLPASTRALLFASGRTAEGKETHVGLGFRLATDGEGRMYVHHGGESVGGRAFVLGYPQQKVAVVLLSNLSFAPFGEKGALAIASHFLSER